MSTNRGSDSRKRAQRYQNTTVYKNDKWDKSERLKALNQMNVSEVCTKCRDVIAWKIKYNKYKALGQPKSCDDCHQRTIVKAYHVLCRACALKKKVCAKCRTSSEVNPIIPPEPNERERIKMDAEMKVMLKLLPERKRRTFMRFMHGKKKSKKRQVNDGEEHEAEDDEEEEKPKSRPKTREELVDKLKQLKMGKDDEEFYEGVLGDDESDSDDYEDYTDSDEGEEEE